MLPLILALSNAQAKETPPNLKVKSFTRVELGAHLVVETEGDDAEAVASVELSGEGLEHSGLVYQFESDRLFTTSPGYSFLISKRKMLRLSEANVRSCESLPCDWTVVGGVEHGTIEARIVDDLLQVQVAIHDRELIAELAEKDDLKLSWSSSEGDHDNNIKPVSVSSLWSTTVETEDSATLSLVAYDSKGDSTDSLTETVSVVEGSGEAIEYIALSELDNKQYALDVITSSDEVGAMVLQSTITDGEDTLLSAESDLPLQVERQFVFEDLTFEEDPDGESYEIILHLTHEDGTVESVSDFYTFKTGDDSGEAARFDWGAIRADVSDGGDFDDADKEVAAAFDLLFAVPGHVRSVSVSWGSSTGPEPSEEDFEPTLTTEWQRWSTVFETDRAINDSVEVEVELLTSDGESLDVVGAEGGIDIIYASFGKGTKNTTSQASTKPELL